MKPPAFQFYADDFLAGVADMTQAEVGAYILLLCHQWSRGEIPADPSRAALIAKGEVPPLVITKFPGGRNQRMERERQKQSEFRAAQANRGKAGADKRWNGERHSERHSASNGVAIETPMAQAQPDHSSPSPSPSPVSVTATNVVADPATPAATSTKKARTPKPTDAEWLETLKQGPAYAGIDVATEFDKCMKYFSAKSITVSRMRFLNWLNRVPKPMRVASEESEQVKRWNNGDAAA